MTTGASASWKRAASWLSSSVAKISRALEGSLTSSSTWLS